MACAAYKGDAAMGALLLDRGAAMLDRRTVLTVAAMFSRYHIVDMLLKGGVRTDARDVGGLTALEVVRIMGALCKPGWTVRAPGMLG